MKNGRYSNNDSKRRGSERDSVGRFSTTDGGNIRTNDGNESSTDVGSIGVEVQSKSIDGNNPNESGGNAQLKIADGFYFNTNGDIEKIPDGHYIKDGRLRKRRVTRRDASNSPDGNENRDRAETGGNESEFSGESYLREKPINVRGSRQRKQKKITEAQQRMTMVSLLAVACSATFTSIALLTKHKHWSLETEEVKPLAEALNDAFATLPVKAYETILAIIEKWVPWVNLVFVISAIVIPRIEESIKRVESARTPENKRNDRGDARAENYSWPHDSSFGFNE